MEEERPGREEERHEVEEARPDVASLVAGLGAESESARKFAVFKLKGLLSDPSFADAFIHAGGLPALRQAVLHTAGNTQAYALGCLDALLELDMGWECCDDVVLEKALSLAVSHPLVNIVRNALALLVWVVSRPPDPRQPEERHACGFRALKPALERHPQFLGSLVRRLSASDHTLCANALQLVNALMRDAIAHAGEHEWPQLIKTLQDLGVIGGVGMLMRGDAAVDADRPLAVAILEFQGLTKLLLRKWRDVMVNIELPEHKRALKTLHLLSKPEPYSPPAAVNDGAKVPKHHPEKWRRLGFETESPAWEFDETGYLGMMNLVEYARRNEDAYQKILMAQSAQPREQRCPIARASLGVTLILYEHFEIDDGTADGFYDASLDREQSVDTLFKPLLLQWGRLHTAALNAFIRLWNDAGAEQRDFYKVEELVRIVVERTVGAVGRKTDVNRVEDELRLIGLDTARRWQMENLNDVYQDAWGPYLVPVREQLRHESLQFMKEQRIRCMLQGSWFPTSAAHSSSHDVTWRYVKLSHNRRWLHHQEYATKGEDEPSLSDLQEKIDLNLVTSVDSNVSAPEQPVTTRPKHQSSDTQQTPQNSEGESAHVSYTKITILGTSPTPPWATLDGPEEHVLLELYPATSHLASEWLDGLLMLLDQQPITKDTARWIEMMEDWGVRLRMLNLRWDDVDWEALEAGATPGDDGLRHGGDPVKPVPSREGLDEEYWYALPDEV